MGLWWGYGAAYMEGEWRGAAFSILRKVSAKAVIYQIGAPIERSPVSFHRKALSTPKGGSQF